MGFIVFFGFWNEDNLQNKVKDYLQEYISENCYFCCKFKSFVGDCYCRIMLYILVNIKNLNSMNIYEI